MPQSRILDVGAGLSELAEISRIATSKRYWPILWSSASTCMARWRALSRRHQQIPFFARLFLFGVGYYMALKFSADPTTRIPSPFWLPNSILLCALLCSQPRHWWLILLVTIPIRLTDSVLPAHPIWYRLTATAISAAQAAAGAWAFRSIAPPPNRFGLWRDWLALGAVLLIAAASEFLMAWLGLARGNDYWGSLQFGLTGHSLAFVVVTPALLTWFSWARSPPPAIRTMSAIEASVLVVALLWASYEAFISTTFLSIAPESKFFLPIPLLYWAALRFGMAGASVAVLIVTSFTIHSQTLLQTLGLLNIGLGKEQILILSRFLFVRVVPVYVVAGLVEQRRYAELSLRESEKRFRTLANTAPVLIWMSGTDKLCDFFNQVWLDFTGRPLEAELGNGWADGVHPDDLEQCLHIYQTAFDARRPFRMEYRLRNRDGDYRWILHIGVPRFDPDNTFRGYIGSAFDITEQRQAHENNAHIGQLQQLAQMGELTASIAHELRQPLGIILLHLGTLRTQGQAAGHSLPESEEILSEISQNCRRADDILKSIRRQVRKREEQFEPIDVNSVVLDLKSLMSGEGRRRRVKITDELASDLPLVDGARTEILQVLLNLVSNAMDAMEDTPSMDRGVTLRTQRHGDDVQVSVLDCGHGIKPTDMGSLFDTFFTTRSNGMGLGLSIVQSIMRSHRGRVWAENIASGGAAFHITLPISRTTAPFDNAASTA
jgi:PAS domain S-box-containing protein